MPKSIKNNEITQSLLRQLFDYEFITGFLFRKSSMGGYIKGTRAGSLLSSGYRTVGVNGRRYAEHVLIWIYVTGAWPEFELDHKNKIKNDNSWNNLRLSTRSQNCANKSMQKNNSSGYTGVTRTSSNKWQARLKIRDKRIQVGTFNSKQEAYLAYLKKKEEVFGEFA